MFPDRHRAAGSGSLFLFLIGMRWVGKGAHGRLQEGSTTRSKRSDRKLKAQTRPRESLGGGVVEARE